MKRPILIIALLLLIITAYSQQLVNFDNKNISYMGRVDFSDKKAAKIFWPGTSVTLNFSGTDVKAILKNGRGTSYFYVIVDNDQTSLRKIKPDTSKTAYSLASGLFSGKHTVQLFQLTDNTTITSFFGFELNNGAKVLKAARPLKRKIEFYGNSITAGHGVEVPEGKNDSGAPEYFNNYYTYAALTARHYNAQYYCISRSGIGIMVSWFPIIMPEMFDRLNPSDPASKWDFSKFIPDIVVINLFQNDQSLTGMPGHEQFKARFGTKAPDEKTIVEAYQNFLKSIRNKYPKASIICVLGSMGAVKKGSPWPGYIEKAVKASGDSKIYAHFFPYKNTPGHPKIREQQAMANDLIKFIDGNIKW